MDSIQINAFLQKSGLDKMVRAYYMGKLQISDNEETYKLLKIVTTKNDEFFPIYFNTLNELVEVADGAVAEMSTNFCFEIIINYPSETFKYFVANHGISSKYAKSLGSEFYFKKEGTSDLNMNFNEFQYFLKSKLDLENMDINRAFTDFIDEIRRTIKEMD